MPPGKRSKIEISVEACPHCGNAHKYGVWLKSLGTLIVGGGEVPEVIRLDCLTMPDKKFDHEISIGNNEEVDRVVYPWSADEPELSEAGTAQEPNDAADYAEWIKVSRATLIDFAKTMLTASSGAIPVYFAVLKYLGTEKLSDPTLGRLTILPPALFLIAVGIFGAGLLPKMAELQPADFKQFRESRLKQFYIFVCLGLATFFGGLVLALWAFATTVWP